MESIREALLETVSCMLSADNEIRRLAEERQKALEVTDEYSIHLAEIILTHEEALEERQMSSVLLKKYIRAHWVSNINNFVEPVVTENTKKKLRTGLPQGLADTTPKIQGAVASVLAVIAQHDFPNDWGEMSNIILRNLSSTNYFEVIGGLHFLDECSKLLALHNLALLAPMMYNILYKICENEEYLTNYRSLVINFMPRLLVADRAFSRPNRQDLVATVSKFVNLFTDILNQPYGHSSDFLIKGEIVKFMYSIDTLVEELTEKIALKVLPVAWEVLLKCNAEYIKVVMNLQSYPRDCCEISDPVNFINLVDNLFTLVQHIVKTIDAGREFLFKFLSDVLYNLVSFMCITTEIENTWASDDEEFYKEDEDRDEGNLRSHVRNVLISLIEDCPYDLLASSLETTMCKVLDETRTKPYANCWWRPQESMMYAIGTISSVAGSIVMCNIKSHLTYWINFLNPQNIRDYPILYARALWIGGKLSKFLQKDEMVMNLNSLLNGMVSPQNIIRISSVRAMYYHCLNMDNCHPNVSIFVDHLDIIIERLITAATEVNFLLKTVLDCIASLISFNYLLVPPVLDKILPFLNNVFWKHMTNCVIMDKCNVLIAEFSKNNHCVQYVHSVMLPEILKAITATYGQIADINDSQNAGLNALKTIIEFAPLPINQQLLEQSFMTMYKVILTVEEAFVLESAAHCLCTYLLIAPMQLFNIRGNLGETGVDYVVHIIRHMLDPQISNQVCKGIGRLCITTLKCLSEGLYPHHLNCIIKSSLTRMNYYNDPLMEDCLIIIFAYLCNNYIDTFIDTLGVIPGPDGGSALAFIFSKWLKRNFTYQGKYESNLCTVALSKVLEFAVLKNDDRLLNILIAVDEPNSLGNNATIPLVARIYQLLVQILIYSIKPDTVSDVDSDCSDVLPDMYDVYVTLAGKQFVFDEYILNINITEYLREYMRTFSQTSHFYTLLNYLSDEEKMDLRATGIIPNN